MQKYGRTTIDVSLQGEGIYYFDFSVSVASKNIYTYEADILFDEVAEDNTSYAQNCETIVKCEHCGEEYKQIKKKQAVGFKEREEDICPYCRKCNQISMEWDFHNIKI